MKCLGWMCVLKNSKLSYDTDPSFVSVYVVFPRNHLGIHAVTDFAICLCNLQFRTQRREFSYLLSKWIIGLDWNVDLMESSIGGRASHGVTTRNFGRLHPVEFRCTPRHLQGPIPFFPLHKQRWCRIHHPLIPGSRPCHQKGMDALDKEDSGRIWNEGEDAYYNSFTPDKRCRGGYGVLRNDGLSCIPPSSMQIPRA